jgi:hypothetical protein
VTREQKGEEASTKEDEPVFGVGGSKSALNTGYGLGPPIIDPCFQRLWDSEWDDYLHRTAIGRVKSRVSARQFQLFDLHVLQGLSVRDAAKAAGASMASVYMAKSRIRRFLRREIEILRRE